jgi:hypothetical protein
VVIERLGMWIGQHLKAVLAWFDHLSGGVQLLIIIVVALLVVAAAHLDELRRERQWRLFRLWLERRRRAGVLRLPREMRGRQKEE